MINLKNLTIKNFMSVGNLTQAVDFHKDHLTLVLGENLDQGGDGGGHRNGVGKSAILNALSYALFGQALTNIKKDNLINKINGKNMLVTLSFEKDGIQYRIERGRKPSIMRFYVNDKEQESVESNDSQGDLRETQKDIDLLLGMSHDMFQHIVALNTYTEPFLSMRTSDQRMIIEQLLGITLLSEKADALKEQIRLTKDGIVHETSNIDAIKRSNERIQQSINSLETKQKAWFKQHQADCDKLKKSINELQQVDIEAEIAQHAKLKEYLEKAAKINSLTKEKATLETALIQAEKSLKKYTKELSQLADRRCPTCDHELHDHKHNELHRIAEKNRNEAEAYLIKVGEDLIKVNDELSVYGEINGRPKTYYDSLEEALRHQNNLSTLDQSLTYKINETDPYQDQIDELKHTAIQEISWDTVNELSTLRDHQEFLLKLLTNKESFIRKKIIDQNLSYLNSRLTHYLDKMGLPHQVKFQNDLSVEITQLGQDLDFDNLSRGERNRVIISLSLAFRDVWESLYQKVNILMIDELLDNGLDAAGVDCSLSILKNKTRTSKSNIWLISHREDLISRVNSIFKVVKENGFTRFESDEVFDDLSVLNKESINSTED